MISLVAESVRFYSQNDEDAFFEWLEKIPCIDQFSGEGRKLVIELSNDVAEEELRDIIALFYRYKVEMRQLAKFLNDENSEWFLNKINYWHDLVFN